MPLRHRDFEYTPQLETAAVWTCESKGHIAVADCLMTCSIAVAPTIAALVANLIVLGFAVAIFRNPKTRSLLRRQSLLMLLSVQVASVIQGVAYMCVIRTCYSLRSNDRVTTALSRSLLDLLHGVRHR
jgi:hypothetical protein